MLSSGRFELVRKSRDLGRAGPAEVVVGSAAVKRRRRSGAGRASADADAAADAAPAAPSACSSSRRTLLLLGAAASLASTSSAPPAHAALLVLDDDGAAERAFAAGARAVVGLAVERRPGDPLIALGSGTVWASVPVSPDDEGASGSQQKQQQQRYKDLYVVATYRQVAGVARSDARESGGLPSLRVFVAGGEGGGTDASSDEGDSVGPYAAEVLGLDPTRDLAVLRARVPFSCPAAPLPLAAAGPQQQARPGSAVFLLGRSPSPSASLSSGVVSALGRSAPAPSGARLYGAVQTDAKVGVSNVGGPLVDSRGALVGVAVCPTFSFSREAGGAFVQPSANAGISFALPAQALLEAVPNLAAYGTASGRV